MPSPADLEARAAEAATLLRQLSHEGRLLLLCHLVAEDEMSVGQLSKTVQLSQSALSQHLAQLRREGLVACRREGTTIHYRLADPRVATLIGTLRDLFCPPDPQDEKSP